MNEGEKRERCTFYHEAVASIEPALVPERLRKDRRFTHTWSAQSWINELIRIPENSHHIIEKGNKPVSIYGLEVDQLQQYLNDLIAKAKSQRETYRRRGKLHERAQKVTQPILFCAVASYPEPDMDDTPQRRRWIQLAVDAMRRRFGAALKAVVAHFDEAFFHLHFVCDLEGASVRSLHSGHRAADAEPVKTHKGDAYRKGCREVQDWYFEHVGKPMGWLRKSPNPHPHGRVSRTQALRNRQREIENNEAELVRRRITADVQESKLVKDRQKLLEWESEIQLNSHLNQRCYEQKFNELQTMRNDLEKERALAGVVRSQYSARKEQIEREAAELWKTIGEAVERTLKWQREIKDQLALEQRVSNIRMRYAPGDVKNDDDDYSDVPF